MVENTGVATISGDGLITPVSEGTTNIAITYEGRTTQVSVAVVAPDQAGAVLQIWQGLAAGRDAARIGRIVADSDRIILETSLGGERFIEELEDDPLPRIC